jgi:hypothetical protein
MFEHFRDYDDGLDRQGAEDGSGWDDGERVERDSEESEDDANRPRGVGLLSFSRTWITEDGDHARVQVGELPRPTLGGHRNLPGTIGWPGVRVSSARHDVAVLWMEETVSRKQLRRAGAMLRRHLPPPEAVIEIDDLAEQVAALMQELAVPLGLLDLRLRDTDEEGP